MIEIFFTLLHRERLSGIRLTFTEIMAKYHSQPNELVDSSLSISLPFSQAYFLKLHDHVYRKFLGEEAHTDEDN